ncbi:MAG: type II CAAX endopeptidase family protein [Saprospiraceae bacterium]|nr:type II CAAX endopeptidase family protein [Saprospiraceae bacterium]
MTLLKSIGNTALFIVFLHLISCWIWFEASLKLETVLVLDHFITPIVTLLIVLIYLGMIKDANFLMVSKSPPFYYVLAFFLGVTFVYLQTPLNNLYNIIFGTDYNIEYEFTLENLMNYQAFSTILIVPVYEEFFFRKFIQNNLQKSIHPVIAFAVSSLLFGVIHLPFYTLLFEGLTFTIHHAYITFFGGMISGFLFYKSKSIGPSIVMHCMWNFGACVL